MCQSIAAAASYMDGGAAHPLQKAALPLVRDLDWVRQDILALQKHFRMKRDIFLEVHTVLLGELAAKMMLLICAAVGGFQRWRYMQQNL
jgi:hypothetical protein